jgi:cytochrome c
MNNRPRALSALVRLAMLVLPIALVACREEGVIPRQAVAGGDPSRGERAILAIGCGSCHVIPGIPAADGRVGPPLTDVADRTFLAGGRVRNEPEEVVRWIRNPQAIHPGSAMPDLGVTEADARDIAAYLYTLGANPLGPPHPIPARHLPGH